MFFGFSAGELIAGGINPAKMGVTVDPNKSPPPLSPAVREQLAAAGRAAAERDAADLLKQMTTALQLHNYNKVLASTELEKNRTRNLTVAQWADAVRWMSEQRRVAEEELTKLRGMDAEMQRKASFYSTIAPLASQSASIVRSAEANVGRVAELENFTLQEFEDRQRLMENAGGGAGGGGVPAGGGASNVTAAATGVTEDFPVWGYLLGGVVIIGGALFLSRK